MDDGAYHEEDEEAERISLRVQDIVAVEWATSFSLSLGSNDYTPALVLHVMKPTSGKAVAGTTPLLYTPTFISHFHTPPSTLTLGPHLYTHNAYHQVLQQPSYIAVSPC